MLILIRWMLLIWAVQKVAKYSEEITGMAEIRASMRWSSGLELSAERRRYNSPATHMAFGNQASLDWIPAGCYPLPLIKKEKESPHFLLLTGHPACTLLHALAKREKRRLCM
jgi:hypothetical protein